MPDDKHGRIQKAREADRRQREREVAEAMARGDEPEPVVDEAALDALTAALEPLQFPATGAEVVAAAEDHEVGTAVGVYTVDELVPDVLGVTFDAPSDVRRWVRRPAVAVAMRRVVEAAEVLGEDALDRERRERYAETLEELAAVDDEGVLVVADWLVERIDEDEDLPAPAAVHERALAFCRANGYETGPLAEA